MLASLLTVLDLSTSSTCVGICQGICFYTTPSKSDIDEEISTPTTAVARVTIYMLTRVWNEFEYRCDAVYAAGGTSSNPAK